MINMISGRIVSEHVRRERSSRRRYTTLGVAVLLLLALLIRTQADVLTAEYRGYVAGVASCQ